jgi:hypothetical protein
MFTDYAIEQMGFRRKHDNESVHAAFTSVHAFEVQGISSSSELLVESSGSVGGVGYRLALAEKLNVGAQSVASYDFADDEPAWVAERKCWPSYLLIHVGPTATHEMSGGFLKEEVFGLHSYNAFIPARRELREMEAKVIPSLLSGLSCTFGTLPNPARFRKLERIVRGKTTDGKNVLDYGIEMRAEIRTGCAVSLSELEDRIKCSGDLATRISSDVSHFFHLALQEDDPLKRFLYFFLTIERQTHATFKSTNHAVQMAGLLQAPERVQVTGAAFFGGQHERWKSLQERFVWCALTVWTHLTDADVDNFVTVKKVRNQIAHGEIAAPPASAVLLVELVAARLQLAPRGEDA